jgi:hypothetical protein
VDQTRGLFPAVEGVAPVLPLIVGGDDLVLLCDGGGALDLARAYLRAFERTTAEDAVVRDTLRRGGSAGLSCSAGVAIVKAHFPFEASVRLAESLLLEAKQVKDHARGPCSALAFHVLYDSTDADLDRLRTAATVGPDVRLFVQPYVVSDGVGDVGWMRGRQWDDLVRRVTALDRRDVEGGRLLPGSQMHDLRESLFIGRAAADARLGNLWSRYERRGLDALVGDRRSLFWPSPGGGWQTGLLDAMDASGFVAVQAR